MSSLYEGKKMSDLPRNRAPVERYIYKNLESAPLGTAILFYYMIRLDKADNLFYTSVQVDDKISLLALLDTRLYGLHHW